MAAHYIDQMHIESLQGTRHGKHPAKAITSSHPNRACRSHSSQETPESTFEGIGSFSHSPFSFLSQTPSFGMTKR